MVDIVATADMMVSEHSLTCFLPSAPLRFRPWWGFLSLTLRGTGFVASGVCHGTVRVGEWAGSGFISRKADQNE